ncbi:MAG: sugar O-acetyltransferase [Pseudomonadota bacterium]
MTDGPPRDAAIERADWDRMVSGALYDPGDPYVKAQHRRAQALTREYNATISGEFDARRPILDALLGSYGTGCAIQPPFHVDYGRNIHLGDRVFFNFGCVVLDICPVTIGSGTQIGPGSQLLAADHPRDAATRAKGLENGLPVTVGANVWIGAAALILPGVTIGDDAVIGAGAVVTRDVPPGATVAGNPARPL